MRGRCWARPYSIMGTVEEGARRGRIIGVPTANLRPDSQRLIPADGVYATWAFLPDSCTDRPRASVTNIGVRPTVDGRLRRIETHLMDFPDAGES